MNICECNNIGRSMGTFTDQVVESDVISQLITHGTNATTVSGNEAWSFAVITDKNEIKRLSDESKEYLLKNLEEYPYFRYENRLHNENFNIFYNATCLLLIYGDSNHRCNVYNCTLAASNIMQDANNYDLRTCWIGFAEHVCDTEEFKSRYKILDHYKLVCALSVGYPTLPSSKPAKAFFTDKQFKHKLNINTQSECNCCS